MWLADTSIKRPVFATMVILGLVVLGIVSYPRIGVDLFPKVDFPIVNIRTTLKGADPGIMDIDVTDKIEEAVNTINGVKSITSTSTEGVSVVTVEFVLERDIDLAVQDVREKVSIVRRRLPTDIDEPIVEKVDPDATPVLWLALTGEKSVREISTYADEVLKEQLQRINGVGAIRVAGLRLRQVRVWLDANKLRAYQITAHDVMIALQRENVELPSGRIESDTKEYSIKVKGEFPRVQDFNDLIVGYHNGAPVRVRDIGRAEDGMEEKRSIARFNGMTGVGMGIQKQSGTNTVEVVERVKKELSTIRKTIPPGMRLEITFDQSDFIKRSINEVQRHLIYGGFFATLAVLLFLKSIRVTLISALAIPTSIIATFAIMNAFGFTFNNMTMLGLSLCIGILIDDAIIVIENIHRNIEEGMKPREAASFATSEIGLAVMATTFAIVAIFLPVAFMKGIIGRFFLQFALTVVFAVLVSLFVSFTLTPMLASRYLKLVNSRQNTANRKEDSSQNTGDSKQKKTKELSTVYRLLTAISNGLEKGYKKIEDLYRELLKIALRHRAIVIIMATGIFAFSIFMTRFIGKEFVPPEDQSRFIVRLQAPIDYSVDEVDLMFKKAEDIIKGVPEVETVFYSQGSGLTREVNKASMFIGLKPKAEREKRQQQIMVEVRKKLRQSIPGLKASAEDVSLVGGGQRNVPIQYSIRGTDLKNLEAYTADIERQFSKLPGIVDVDTSLETGKPEVRVFIDRDKAADLDVDIATVAETINFLIGGEVDVTKFKDEGKGRRYDVRARLNPEDRKNPDDIGRLYVRSKDGRLVEISNIVHIQEAGGPSIINRVDRQRAITLFANLEGKPLGEAKAELDSISARVLPPDYSGRHKGMAEVMGESFQYLIFALVLGIIMAYMVLASQFESFIHPFTVLLSMPLSFIGAFGALLITGKTLNIFSFIGLILLMGLVKKNAILLVDYTNTLRARGMERREAILKAGPVRLRPILMTTVAMIFGMLPVAVGLGEGAETRSPMGIAVIGGLLTSLFLTLVVVPVVYDLFDDLQEKFMRKKKHNMRWISLLVVPLILFIPFRVSAEEIIKKGELLNLERCIEIALMRQPNIIAAANTVNVNQSRIGQAKANYYPQIDLSSGYSRVSPVARDNNNSFDQYTGSVTLKQNIYDFGKTSTQVNIQNLNLDSSKSDLANVTEQIILNVKQSYYGVLQAKKNRDVADEAVKQFQSHLEQAKGFYDVGTKPKFDVTKAEVDLSNSRLNLIKAENSLRLAVATLNNAIGVPDAPEYTIEDNLSFKKYEISFNEAIERAYKNRPELASVVFKREAAEKSIKLANTGYYPVVTGNAAYNRSGEKFPLGEGWNAGMTLSFPIFSGFLTKYQVEEAKANLDVLKANEELLRQNIFLEVQQAYLNLKEAEERIPVAELVVKQAEENLELANGRYAAGVGNPIEVTDAQVGLSNAKSSYIQALYDYKVALANLVKAMGIK